MLLKKKIMDREFLASYRVDALWEDLPLVPDTRSVNNVLNTNTMAEWGKYWKRETFILALVQLALCRCEEDRYMRLSDAQKVDLFMRQMFLIKLPLASDVTVKSLLCAPAVQDTFAAHETMLWDIWAHSFDQTPDRVTKFFAMRQGNWLRVIKLLTNPSGDINNDKDKAVSNSSGAGPLAVPIPGLQAARVFGVVVNPLCAHNSDLNSHVLHDYSTPEHAPHIHPDHEAGDTLLHCSDRPHVCYAGFLECLALLALDLIESPPVGAGRAGSRNTTPFDVSSSFGGSRPRTTVKPIRTKPDGIQRADLSVKKIKRAVENLLSLIQPGLGVALAAAEEAREKKRKDKEQQDKEAKTKTENELKLLEDDKEEEDVFRPAQNLTKLLEEKALEHREPEQAATESEENKEVEKAAN